MAVTAAEARACHIFPYRNCVVLIAFEIIITTYQILTR
jgi:hypothetical protein